MKEIDKRRQILTIGICAMLSFICLGFCSSNKGLYLAAITEALEIPRGLFSVGDSIRYVTAAVVNFFFGSLVARFGTKKMILTGVFSLMIYTFLYSVSGNIYGFYAGGFFLGLGVSLTTTAMVGCVVRRIASKNAGKILGFILATNGIGSAIATQIFSPIIYADGQPFGYRKAYRIIICILLALAAVIIFLYKEPDAGAEEKKKKASEWAGPEYRELIGRNYFRVMLVCVFFTGFVLQSIVGIAAAHMKDVGLDAEFIAITLSVHSVALACFKFLFGAMRDKIGLRKTMSISYITAVIVIYFLAILTSETKGLAMIYSIFSSLAMPLETIMLPLITAEVAGSKAYDKTIGLVVCAQTIGYAAGTPTVNMVYDRFGSYSPILYIMSAVMAVVLPVLLTCLSKAKKVRMQEAAGDTLQ